MNILSIDGFIDTFINGDYFIIFLAIMFIILIVLIIALIKARGEYNELLEEKNNIIIDVPKEEVVENKPLNVPELDPLEDLLATSKNDMIDEETPLIKQIDVAQVRTYDDVIDEYESSEEENAVISTDELNKIAQQRINELGSNSNQVVIQKYEEEQENKAIISYEQLLKNASNISLTYKDEKVKKGAPKIQKIEIEQKEITPPENYLKEEEFLRILKDFRMTL